MHVNPVEPAKRGTPARPYNWRSVRDSNPLSFTDLEDTVGVPDPRVERVVQRPLDRVLAFTGRTIDDVVNGPMVKNQVHGYYKLYRQVQRVSDIRDLERQWNSTA